MQSVKQWLEQLGLPQYSDTFAENDVDFEALCLLTDAELEKLGVSLGHRKKLLKAIAAFDELGVRARSAIQARPNAPSPEASSAEAERRQLTVMFCDLAGSTELATKLDPEPLRDLMQAYQRTCRAVIERYDGHIAQYLGDGVMVYFGWPRAHEDDAARAIRAGLEVAQAVSELKASVPIRTRVGIHTGLVVVGETGQGDASMPKAAVGETPNIAARLQALADPGSVLVSERTRGLAAGVYDYAELGVQPLKGLSEAMRVYRVMGARAVDSRFEASRSESALTPLVGREEELALLLRRWQEAKEGEGKVVLVAGEPGIGKSRLTRALRERLTGERYTPLRYQCSPYHVHSALHSVIEQVGRAAGFARGDSPEQKLEKLEAVLAGSATQVAATAPLIAAMLSLPLDRYPPLNLSPRKQKEKTLEALAAQVEVLAQRQPVLMIYEDAHWIDPTTQESLDLLVPRLRRLPVLLIVTYRPEYTPKWAEQAHVTVLGLGPLGRRQGAELVARVAGGKSPPAEVLEHIVAHTDGVPLFVEELTKSILESKLLREEGDRYVLDGPLPALAIPTTLRDSLIARLDRLAPVREVAQVGACIGREFAYDLLAAVSPLKGAQLDDALAQLTASGLLFRRGMPPEASYTFKHALMQDAAYDSLLKSRRVQLHAQIAEALEKVFAERATKEPEVLAYHFTQAEFAERAIRYWERAGGLAMARAASKEAAAHFRKALGLLPTLPDSRARKLHEIALQCALGGALLHVAGIASHEVERTYARTRELCQDVGDSGQLFLAEWGLCHVHVARAEHVRAKELADGLFVLAKREGNSAHLLQAHHAAWSIHNALGQAAEARAAAERGWALYDHGMHKNHAFAYGGHDPAVCSRNIGSWAVWRLGFPDQALAWQEAGLALARQLHSSMLAHTFTWAAFLHQFRRDLVKLGEQAQHAATLAREQGLVNNEAEASMLLGWLMAEEGQPEAGIRLIRQSMAIRETSGAIFHNSYFLGLLAQAHARAGNVAQALGLVSAALSFAETRSERWYVPELLRLKGEYLVRQGGTQARNVEASLQEAVSLARTQGTKSFELRAAASLARFWAEQGKRQKAHAQLAPVYGWFTEGFDTADLQDAKALLDELS